jgi:hypothetical protein
MNIGDIKLTITPSWANEASLRFNTLLKLDSRVPDNAIRFFFHEEKGLPVYSIEKVTLDLSEIELQVYSAVCYEIFEANKNL